MALLPINGIARFGAAVAGNIAANDELLQPPICPVTAIAFVIVNQTPGIFFYFFHLLSFNTNIGCKPSFIAESAAAITNVDQCPRYAMSQLYYTGWNAYEICWLDL